LGYEIADNTTIINVHSGSISVENSGNSYLCRGTNFILDILDMGKSQTKNVLQKLYTYPMLPMVIKHQSFSHSLSFIIAASDSCKILPTHQQKLMYNLHFSNRE
jgi:hypothetical protein